VEHTFATGAPAWVVALEGSALAFFIRDSTWLYPFANLTHILGLALLVGPILVLDLRLIGITRAGNVADLSRLITLVAVKGLCLLLVSGSVIFIADASALATNPVFLIKIALLAIGIANAVTFRILWQARLPTWDRDRPGFGRFQAMLSPVVWLGTASCGRLIAYF